MRAIIRDNSASMEALPLHFPSPISVSSSATPNSSPSSSSHSATSSNLYSSANALLKACDQQSTCSFTNLTTSDAISHHQLYHCIHVDDEQARISKKRKQLAASSMQEEAHDIPTTHRKRSPQSKVDDRSCQYGVSIIKDDQTLYEEEGNQEELVGCTTPPYAEHSTCNAAHAGRIRELNDNEDPIGADLVELRTAQASAPSIVDDNQFSCHQQGEKILLHDIIIGEGIESMCTAGCRGPPPAPRKPKAKPRNILKSSHLNFFIPPDLELFFSSTCASNHDA